MIKWDLNCGTLEFDEDLHIYILNGIVIPSVSQIVNKLFPNKYADIPKWVLEMAAQKGIAVHEAIEMYEKAGELSSLPELQGYIDLKKKECFECVFNEKPIIVFVNGNPICAGRLDMVTKQEVSYGIEDIKRTQVVDEERLFLQLNLYAIGAEQIYGITASYLKCLHLREKVAERIDIELNKQKTIQKIKEILEC